jgi:predicted phage tail protein
MAKILGGSGGGTGGGGGKIASDNLFSQDVIEFQLALCEGPIAGLVHGPHTFYIDDTPLISKSGESNYSSFEVALYHGDANASSIVNKLGGTSSTSTVSVNLATNTPVTRTTSSSMRNMIDQLEIRVIIQQLYKTSGGDTKRHDITFSIKYRQSGKTEWNYVTGGNITLHGKTTGGYAKEYIQPVPRISGDWEIQVELLSDDSDTKRINTMSWESIQMVTMESRAYDNLAVVKGLGEITDEMSSSPTFSGVYAAKVVRVPSNFDPLTRHYEGTWDGTFKMAHTDSLMWCLYDLLMDENYGFKKHYPQLQVDRFSAYTVARYCDELVPRSGGGYQPRYTFNYTLTESTNALELLYYIAGIAGIVPVTNMNGSVRFKADMPGSVVQIFGPESVANGAFSYQFTDISERVNDVTIRFVNPNLGWEADYRRCTDEDAIEKNGRIPKEVEAIGCTDPYEAERRAQRMILQGNTETCSVTFQVARPGMGLELYDLIGITDPDANWGLSGRIKSYTSSKIQLRDALLVPVNTELLMTLQTSEGAVTLTVKSATAQTRELQIVSGSVPSYAPNRAQFALTASGSLGLIKPFRILSIEPDTENPELYTITALEQNLNKYGDADNLETAGTIDYSGSLKDLRPTAPVITDCTCGLGQMQTKTDGTVVDRIYVEWTQEVNTPIKEWHVYYRVQDEDSWQRIVTTEQKAYIRQPELEVTYEISVQAISFTGKLGDMSQLVTAAPTAAVPELVPATPTGWSGQEVINGVVLSPPGGDSFEIPAGYSYRIYGTQKGLAFSTAVVVMTAASVPVRIENTVYNRYFIVAVNRYQAESAASAPIDVTPIQVSYDTPKAPTGVSLSTAVVDGENNRARLDIVWQKATNAVSYVVEITDVSTKFALNYPATGLKYSINLAAQTKVSVRVRGVNTIGTEGPYSAASTLTLAADSIPPAVPVNIQVQGGLDVIILEWTRNTESDFSHYEIVASTGTTAPSATAEGKTFTASYLQYSTKSPDLTLNFWVRAVDTSKNKSAWSEMVTGTAVSLDTGSLATPANVKATSVTQNSGRNSLITIVWDAVDGATSYGLRINSTEVYAPSNTYQVSTYPRAATKIQVQARAGVSIKSGWTTEFTHTAARDATAPTSVASGSVVMGIGMATLTWVASTSTDVSSYEVFQGTTSTAPTASSTAILNIAGTTSTISNLATGTKYWWWVRAVDYSDNKSSWTAIGSGTPTAVDGLINDAIQNDTWSSDLGFIQTHTGTTLPTTKKGDTISWNNKLYSWDGTAYVSATITPEISFESVTGTVATNQISPELDKLIHDQGTSAAADKAAAETAKAAAEAAATTAKSYSETTQKVSDEVGKKQSEVSESAGIVSVAKRESILASGNERFQFGLEGWTSNGKLTSLTGYARGGVEPVLIYDVANNQHQGALVTFTRSGTSTVSIDGVTYSILANQPRFFVVGGVRYLEIKDGETFTTKTDLGTVDIETIDKAGKTTKTTSVNVQSNVWKLANGTYSRILIFPSGTI